MTTAPGLPDDLPPLCDYSDGEGRRCMVRGHHATGFHELVRLQAAPTVVPHGGAT